MPSRRLRPIYDSPAWRGPIRRAVLERAGGRCQWTWWDGMAGGFVRCAVMDKAYGGREGLTVDHIDPHGGEHLENLAALCRKHHGHKDGGRSKGGTRSRLW